ncbi:cadherin-like domain-containing protein [Roseiconus nitratireducens]|uniref:cadherin-like domain-containing protein n=1 Tax=Roseiconus nitratireducens TaxID=2605748 RepID=UPI001F419377|nr:cadherin-like domain-containing protein [Roseiconus nitratireducens]
MAQRRVLAVITGAVFHDLDGSLRQEAGEVRLPSRLAYIDANQNGTPDSDEPFSLTDADGQFHFDGLSEGIYPIRLFDGMAEQSQSFPAEASEHVLPVSFSSDPISMRLSGSTLQVLTEQTLIRAETSGTRATEIPLEFAPHQFVADHLPGIEGAGAGPHAIISGADLSDPSDPTAHLWAIPRVSDLVGRLDPPLNVSLASGTLTAETVSVGPDGSGVLLVAPSDPTQGSLNTLYSVRLSVAETDSSPEASTSNIEADLQPTPWTVPHNTQVLTATSAGDSIGSRTIIAWPTSTTDSESGVDNSANESSSLQMALWSNAEATWISPSPQQIDKATELISFDDASGLLAVRYFDGGIGVLDVDAGFSVLHEFSDLHGPATLINGGDALAAVTSGESGSRLTVHDLRGGQLLVEHPLRLADIGTPIQIISGDSVQSFYVLGQNGVASVQFNLPTAHRVEIENASQVVNVDFGIQTLGLNHSPEVPDRLELDGLEDKGVVLSAADLAAAVTDADQDRLISLIASGPSNGTASINSDGDITYQPDANFFGADSFSIQLHDGQSVSSPITVSVSLKSVPDVPGGVTLIDGEIPEHAADLTTVGSLQINDPDPSNDYDLSVSDPRFKIENGSLVLVHGPLNHEFEPEISMTISGYDFGAEQYFYAEVTIAVLDENDPIVYLGAYEPDVMENQPGIFVAQFQAFDEDDDTLTYSVDDDRFLMDEEKLYLKPDQALDFEAEPFVTVTVSADDGHGSSLSTDLKINVYDMPEALGAITLSNQTVMELKPGATVGTVQIAGGAIANNHLVSVDDQRFEIDGSTLKLRDGEWVQRSVAEQIELTISAEDTAHLSPSVSESFVIEVLQNQSAFHNVDVPQDVDGNGVVSPIDALTIINYLNIYGPGEIGPGDPSFGYDVNGDNDITPLDALLVINFLNTAQNSTGSVSGPPSGENVPATPAEGEPDTPDGLRIAGPDGEGEAAPADSQPLQRQAGAGSVAGINDAPVTDPESGTPTADDPNLAESNRADAPTTPRLRRIVVARDAALQSSDWLDSRKRDETDPQVARAVNDLLKLLHRRV